jgi:hypothetical protein
MRVIIAGSRHTWLSVRELDAIVADAGFDVTEAVCGCAEGVDTSVGHCQVWGRWVKAGACKRFGGEIQHGWACQRGIAVEHFPADWQALGYAAGPMRNNRMADYTREVPDGACIAVPAADSRGTWDMVRKARARKLKVYIKRTGA